MVLPPARTRMDIQLHRMYCDIITGDDHNKNFLSIERAAGVRIRSLKKETSFTFCLSFNFTMIAPRPGDCVSITSTDELGNFEPHVAWPCKVVKFEGSAESKY